MNIGFHFREALRKVSFWLEEELDRLIAGLQEWSRVEHHDDGTHGEVTADTLAVAGALTTDTIDADTGTIDTLTTTALTATAGTVALSASSGGVVITPSSSGDISTATNGVTWTAGTNTAFGVYGGVSAGGTQVYQRIDNETGTVGWKTQTTIRCANQAGYEATVVVAATTLPQVKLEATSGATSPRWSVDSTLGILGAWNIGARTDLAINADGVQVIGLQAAGDRGGKASTVEVTNVSDVSANSSGVGQILFKGTTNRDTAGFIKIYIGTTAYYVPVFTAITG